MNLVVQFGLDRVRCRTGSSESVSGSMLDTVPVRCRTGSSEIAAACWFLQTQFAAAQAAQKRWPCPDHADYEFAAAQAAQKKNTMKKLMASLFAAAQAAQKFPV